MITNNGANADLVCQSTDEKPTDAAENQLLIELDTGDLYYYSGDEWAKFGAATENSRSISTSKSLDIDDKKTEIDEKEIEPNDSDEVRR